MRVTNIRKEYKTTGLVESESKPGAFYKVLYENGQLSCTCPHHTKAGANCKHINAFKEELEYMKEQREEQTRGNTNEN